MHTGTLIQDLMLTVERAELRSEQQRIADELELKAIFAMQIPATEIQGTDGETVFMGAA